MALTHSPTRPLVAGFLIFDLAHWRWRMVVCLTPLALLADPAYGQQDLNLSLQGVVTDTEGVPLTSASVFVDPGGIPATTDWAGEFTLSGLNEGDYLISVSHIGYFPRQVGPIRIRNGGVPRLRIELHSRPMLLDEAVVASKSRYQHLAPDIPGQIITRREWNRSGVDNLSDALKMIPGLTVLEGGSTLQVTYRGSPSRAMEIDRDGVPLKESGSGETDLTSVRLADLEAIAVESTGSGGKVHLISRNLLDETAEEAKHICLSGGARSSEGAELDVSIGRKTGFAVIEAGAGSSVDRGNYSYHLPDGSRHRRINDDQRIRSGFARINRKGRKLEMSGAIYGDFRKRGVPNLIYSPPTPDASLESSSVTVRLGLTRRLGTGIAEGIAYSRQYQGEFTNPEYQTHPESGEMLHFSPEQTLQTGSREGIIINLHRLSNLSKSRILLRATRDSYLGKDLLTDRVRVGVGFGEARRITYEAELGSGFEFKKMGWRALLSPGLTGLHVNDRAGKSFGNILPNVSISLERVHGKGSISLTARRSESIVIPSFNALLTTGSQFVAGNPNLEPERGESVEASLEIRSILKYGLLSFSATPYHRRSEELIVWQRNAFAKYYPDNVGVGRSRGVEFTGAFRGSDDRLNLNVNYIISRSTNETPGDINRGNIIPFNPMNSGSVILNYVWRHWSCHVSGSWVSMRYSTMANYDPFSTAGMGLPAYSILDCSLEYLWIIQTAKIGLTFGVDNLLDEEYRVIERSPMPGRVYYLNTSIKFI